MMKIIFLLTFISFFTIKINFLKPEWNNFHKEEQKLLDHDNKEKTFNVLEKKTTNVQELWNSLKKDLNVGVQEFINNEILRSLIEYSYILMLTYTESRELLSFVRTIANENNPEGVNNRIFVNSYCFLIITANFVVADIIVKNAFNFIKNILLNKGFLNYDVYFSLQNLTVFIVFQYYWKEVKYDVFLVFVSWTFFRNIIEKTIKITRFVI